MWVISFYKQSIYFFRRYVSNVNPRQNTEITVLGCEDKNTHIKKYKCKWSPLNNFRTINKRAKQCKRKNNNNWEWGQSKNKCQVGRDLDLPYNVTFEILNSRPRGFREFLLYT